MDIEKQLNGEYKGHNGVPLTNGHHKSPVGSPKELANGSASDGLMKRPIGILDDKQKRRTRKLSRSNSKDGVLGVAGTPNFVAPHRKWKNSRRSRNGVGRGLPKKNGGGGKGVWGKLGSEIYEELDEEDQNDPNFDLDSYNSRRNIELKEVIPELTDEEFSRKVEPIILEYFEHGDTTEVAASLDEFMRAAKRPLVTKIAVEIAFEHKQSQREMTSVLISDLYGKVIGRTDITKGLDLVLKNLPDLMLDTPEAPQLLANFIARAVADDCIPPVYTDLDKRDTSGLSQPALDALSRAHALLNVQLGWSYLDDVWGVGGGLRPVTSLTHTMAQMLKEYLVSRELGEVQRLIKELEVPHFHHELIYEAIVIMLEAFSESSEEAMCTLFKTLDEACIVSPEQMEQGFRRVYDDLPDIVLDIPLAYSIIDRFVQRCQRADFLSAEVIRDVPSRGRKRFVSEGDGGRIKPVNLMAHEI